MSIYKHYISIYVEGFETEVAVDVDYDFQPAESADRFNPGCDAGVTVNSIKHGDIDFMDFVRQSDGVDELERVIYLDEYEDLRLAV